MNFKYVSGKENRSKRKLLKGAQPVSSRDGPQRVKCEASSPPNRSWNHWTKRRGKQQQHCSLCKHCQLGWTGRKNWPWKRDLCAGPATGLRRSRAAFPRQAKLVLAQSCLSQAISRLLQADHSSSTPGWARPRGEQAIILPGNFMLATVANQPLITRYILFRTFSFEQNSWSSLML